MSIRSPLPLVLAAVVTAALGYAALTPYFAFGALLNAASTGDDRSLRGHVDYAALRDDLAAELRRDAGTARLLGERAGTLEQPFAAIAGLVVSGAAGAIADALATPAGVREVLGVGPLSSASVAEVRAIHDGAQRRYRAWNRFEVSALSPLVGDDVTYRFERRALGWQLTGVRF